MRISDWSSDVCSSDLRKAKDGKAKPPDAPKRDMGLETIAAALTGDIAIHNHCYRAAAMAIVIDMAKEFGYRVAALGRKSLGSGQRGVVRVELGGRRVIKNKNSN